MATQNSVNTGLSGSSGTGSFAGTTSPTFVTPVLGTPTSGTLTNCTGLPVAGGGTGVASTTAYAVLCGGTTTTGPLQSIAGVGSSGQVLTSNGAGALPTFQAAGAGGGTVLSKQIFTSGSGTYTPTAGANYVWIRAVAGGGQGGGCTSTTGQMNVGSGGGAGAYGELWEAATSRAYAVGAGGSTGTSGTGQTGGATTFGTAGAQLNLAGGVGGVAGTSSAASGKSVGGAGGAATTAALGIPGGKGSDGFYYTAAGGLSGMGAASPLGAGGPTQVLASFANVAGVTGTGYGAGGSGAICGGNSSTANGGTGASGVIIITEYT